MTFGKLGIQPIMLVSSNKTLSITMLAIFFNTLRFEVGTWYSFSPTKTNAIAIVAEYPSWVGLLAMIPHYNFNKTIELFHFI